MVSETEVYAALQDVIHPTFGMSLINFQIDDHLQRPA